MSLRRSKPHFCLFVSLYQGLGLRTGVFSSADTGAEVNVVFFNRTTPLSSTEDQSAFWLLPRSSFYFLTAVRVFNEHTAERSLMHEPGVHCVTAGVI